MSEQEKEEFVNNLKNKYGSCEMADDYRIREKYEMEKKEYETKKQLEFEAYKKEIDEKYKQRKEDEEKLNNQ